ncbi:MAG: hypothetical protein COX62_04205 [Deltaproteobacteria bacterium CG_4_10_14_0_2_um_filter_43_8]|nr:MAG: hypothetical protein COV43_06235 [Deltaproteobacteria bacterium CG11_big_fil_rev_8_21_14_0_20_42_23]PJA20699.1 MAG: hypothetical protein COX62_04205 [Deltaproteobacteria bacterium CG_4_10_14_0_2_um_filter_43_8]PJC64430.1 MAG: hypothetical protein CO021_04310 [Deltaproteobacteria bacterium CG_4_9_14_0_2_um_filter_42_21]
MYELCVWIHDRLPFLYPLEEETSVGGDELCALSLPNLPNGIQASFEVHLDKVLLFPRGEMAIFCNGEEVKAALSLQPHDIIDIGDYRLHFFESCQVSRQHIQEVDDDESIEITLDEEEGLPIITFFMDEPLSFAASSLILGRQEGCHVRFSDDPEAKKHVSRKHAEVFLQAGKYRIRDLKSTKGIFLYDNRITECELPVRGLIRLGGVSVPYQISPFQSKDRNITEEGFLLPTSHEKLLPKRFVGHDNNVQAFFKKLQEAVKDNRPLLLFGEQGTGKTFSSRIVHLLHPERKDHAFVTLDIKHIPAHLSESLLFGHETAAVSGAQKAKKGVCAKAHKGTLLLKHIDALPLPVQEKLVILLEEGVVTPVGTKQHQPVDLRLILTTEDDPEQLKKHQKLHGDLFAFCHWKLKLPSLEERKDDIHLLIHSFLQRIQAQVRFERPALRFLYHSPWKRNIRELFATVEQALIRAVFRGNDMVTLDDVKFKKGVQKEAALEWKQQEIISALERNQGNVNKATRELNIPRSTFYRKVKEFNIEIKAYRKKKI